MALRSGWRGSRHFRNQHGQSTQASAGFGFPPGKAISESADMDMVADQRSRSELGANTVRALVSDVIFADPLRDRILHLSSIRAWPRSLGFDQNVDRNQLTRPRYPRSDLQSGF